MSVVAHVDVPAEAFVLGRALRAEPGVSIRLERVIPTGLGPIPYIWVADEHVEALDAALRDDSTVASFEAVDSVDGETLIRVKWVGLPTDFLTTLTESDARVYETVGEGDTWRFSLRFPDHETLTAFYRRCLDRNIEVDPRSVDSSDATDSDLGLEITEAQRETLETALASGYFDVPRRVNLTELARELGISDTATSERLRRGVSTVLTRMLAARNSEEKH